MAINWEMAKAKANGVTAPKAIAKAKAIAESKANGITGSKAIAESKAKAKHGDD